MDATINYQHQFGVRLTRDNYCANSWRQPQWTKKSTKTTKEQRSHTWMNKLQLKTFGFHPTCPEMRAIFCSLWGSIPSHVSTIVQVICPGSEPMGAGAPLHSSTTRWFLTYVQLGQRQEIPMVESPKTSGCIYKPPIVIAKLALSWIILCNLSHPHRQVWFNQHFIGSNPRFFRWCDLHFGIVDHPCRGIG